MNKQKERFARSFCFGPLCAAINDSSIHFFLWEIWCCCQHRHPRSKKTNPKTGLRDTFKVVKSITTFSSLLILQQQPLGSKPQLISFPLSPTFIGWSPQAANPFYKIKRTLMVNDSSRANSATLDLLSLWSGKESPEFSESLRRHRTNFTTTAVLRFWEQADVFVFL